MRNCIKCGREGGDSEIKTFEPDCFPFLDRRNEADGIELCDSCLKQIYEAYSKNPEFAAIYTRSRRALRSFIISLVLGLACAFLIGVNIFVAVGGFVSLAILFVFSWRELVRTAEEMKPFFKQSPSGPVADALLYDCWFPLSVWKLLFKPLSVCTVILMGVCVVVAVSDVISGDRSSLMLSAPLAIVFVALSFFRFKDVRKLLAHKMGVRLDEDSALFQTDFSAPDKVVDVRYSEIVSLEVKSMSSVLGTESTLWIHSNQDVVMVGSESIERFSELVTALRDRSPHLISRI